MSDIDKLIVNNAVNQARRDTIENARRKAEAEEQRAERKFQHIHLWINTSVAVGALVVSIISLIVSLMQWLK